ncbi:hypothetical protein LOTGIDRAFT_127778, partial [Lottia gigantea]
FCQDIYRDIMKNPLGSIIWAYLKPILRGKILYTPDNDLTRQIVTEANNIFDILVEVRNVARAWVTGSPGLKAMVEEAKNMGDLKKALKNDFIKNLIQSTAGVNTDELMDGLAALESDQFDMQQLNGMQTAAELLLNYTECVELSRYIGVDSEADLESESRKLLEDNNFLAGIVFNNLVTSNNREKRSTTNELPKHVQYKIRMDTDNIIQTHRIKRRTWKPGPNADFANDMRYQRGFIQLQDMIENAIIKLQTGDNITTSSDPGVYLQQFPYPCYVEDDYIHYLGSYLLPVLMTFAWLAALGIATRNLCYDRENGQEESLRIMGMKSGLSWIAWFLTTMLLMMVVCIFMALILHYGTVFRFTNIFIIFLYLLAFCLSSTMLCYFVSAFFTRTTLAILTVLIIYFLSYLPYIVLISMEVHMLFWQKIIACLSCTTAFSFGAQYLATLEEIGTGIHWHNIDVSLGDGEDMTFHWSCIMMLIDSAIYFVLGWYIRNVKSDVDIYGNYPGSSTGLLGICPQHNTIFDFMTVLEHMEFYAGIKSENSSKKEITDLLKDVDLWHVRNVQGKNLSGGMQRRLCVAMAFVGQSRAIVLDEPTSGVDPYARKNIWNLILKHKLGRTVLVSTHHLDEADMIGDRVAILHTGKLLCSGSPVFLKSCIGGGLSLTLEKQLPSPVSLQTFTTRVQDFINHYHPNAVLSEDIGTELEFKLPKDSVTASWHEFFISLDKNKQQLKIASYGVSDATLEDVFLKVTTIVDRGEELSSITLKEDLKRTRSNSKDSDSTSDSSSETRKSGCGLSFHQLGAFLLKRFHHYRRDWRMLISVLVLPVILLLAAVGFSRIRPEKYNLPNLLMTPTMYGPNSYMFYNQLKMISDDYLQKLNGYDIDGYLLDSFSDFIEQREQNAADAGIAIIVLMAFCFVPSGLILISIGERLNNEKHIQSISGVGPFFYWLATFIWDFFVYMVSVVCAVIIICIFQPEAYYLRYNLAGFTALLILFGFAILPMMYSMLKLFKTGSAAYLVLFCINMFLGIITVITLLCLLNIPVCLLQHVKLVTEVLQYVFLIFPQYSLCQGLIDLSTNHFKYKVFIRYGDDVYVDPFSFDLLAWNLIALAIQGVVFFCITVVIEYKPETTDSREMLGDYDKEEDVQCESDRISQGQNNEDIFVVNRLTKVFRRGLHKFLAVDNISFGVHHGECFGLLGVNGAGKTTSFRMLIGELTPSLGSASLHGEHQVLIFVFLCRLCGNGNNKNCDILKNIGYCPQYGGLDEFLSAEELLLFYARVKGYTGSNATSMVQDLIDKFKLNRYAKKAIKTYSGGNKRKVSLAIAMIGEPDILFLDEPTTGMDPVTRRLAWKTIHHATRQGQSVVLTSHSMDECDHLCSRLAIMVNGQLKCLGSPQHLKNKFGDGYIVRISIPSLSNNKIAVIQAFINQFPGTQIKEETSEIVQLDIPRESSCVADIFSMLERLQTQKDILEYSLSQTSLDEVGSLLFII